MPEQPYADVLSYGHTVEAIGWLSAELANRADAWDGNAPEWFPEPPEWLDLWFRALAATGDEPASDEEDRRG